ncbi:MaoC/PaaZ C-terminal domain-containing protein [Sporichthya polymorpha]|uniref:MaoC/PaaZ C-terminal domain-containing protein n=1 Tax=Sporichthya polymorpha TaxID=35751 RepID=UPI0003812CF0|nr:MaoC/PaaZ C-terminal domain-containing protein [Sporichthya polymorpha]
MKPGDTLPERTFGPQTRTDIVRYQGASGDFNPVHHDDEFARAGGLPDAISVGMLQAGYLGTYCVDLFGPTAVRSIAVRFAEPVRPGDVLTCAGTVADVRPEGDGRVADLDLRITRSGGGVAVTGAVTVRLEN